MAHSAQQSQSKGHPPINVNYGRQRNSSIANARQSQRLFRWLSILAVWILLWFLGADWRTLVMVGAAASMFAMAVDQIEKMFGR